MKEVLESILHELPYIVVQEFMFAKPFKRKFRSDYFIKVSEEIGIVVEYEGLNWHGRSRHTTNTGYINDCTKYNFAACLGYPVLRFTHKHLDDPEEVKDIILRTIRSVELTL